MKVLRNRVFFKLVDLIVFLFASGLNIFHKHFPRTDGAEIALF